MTRNYRYFDPAATSVRVQPNLAALVRALTDDDLEAEILAKLGAPDYQLALVQEHERRANQEV